jgi:hypothetical protein
MEFDDLVHGMTTMISVRLGNDCYHGSGFFYHEYGEEPVKTEGTMKVYEMKDIWLVTNRHVVLGTHPERVPDELTFKFRRIINNSTFAWEDMKIKREDILERTRIPPSKMYDVAAIRIMDLLVDRLKVAPENVRYVTPFGVNKNHLPTSGPIKPEVGDEVLIIGYPHRNYDKVNLYPIVKFGIISSGWGLNFDGFPYFAVDSRLYHGSSGSLVISKPKQLAIIDGRVKYNPEKNFQFLGVYSEPLNNINRIDIHVGLVWYSYLVEKVISHGVKIGANTE